MNTIAQNQEIQLVTANLPNLLWSMLSKTLEPYIGEPLGTTPPNAELIGLCQNLEDEIITCFGDSMPEQDKKTIIRINKELMRCLTQ